MNGINRFFLIPPIIKTLIIINVVVFIVQHLFLSLYNIGDVSLGAVFARLFYLFPVGDNSYFNIWQLLTYQFIHANVWHIFFNLFALWMFGAELETNWGSSKFLTYYLLCGIGAGLTQLFISPFFGPVGPTIGASGSVYGVLLAFGLTFPNRPIFMFPFFIPIPAKFFVLIYAGLALIMGVSSDGSNVAHFAHLGGALTGFILFKIGDKIGLFTIFSKMFKKKQSYVGNTGGQTSNVYKMYSQPDNFKSKPEPYNPYSNNSTKFIFDGEEIKQSQIDEILDKISASGYQNLTDKEKKLLFELSQKLK